MAASTGGPGALAALLGRMEPPQVPIVIAQHMPADQTAAFARHLAVETRLSVCECGAGQLPSAQVVVLRGGSGLPPSPGGRPRFRARLRRPRLLALDHYRRGQHLSSLRGSVVCLRRGGRDQSCRGGSERHGRGRRARRRHRRRAWRRRAGAGFRQLRRSGNAGGHARRLPSALVASLSGIAERLARWTAPSSRGAAAMAEET